MQYLSIVPSEAHSLLHTIEGIRIVDIRRQQLSHAYIPPAFNLTFKLALIYPEVKANVRFQNQYWDFLFCLQIWVLIFKAEELQCLATWREGSSRFLLGLIKYNHPASFEERFRCFVYDKARKYGPGSSLRSYGSTNVTDNATLRLAQSGDATCNGLSLNEFSRMMTLRKSKFTFTTFSTSSRSFSLELFRHHFDVSGKWE